MTLATQAEFARIAGYGRTRVTQLKQAGRLVMADAKHVDVEASLARIADTQGLRSDVAERHAAARAGQGKPAAPAAPVAGLDVGLGDDSRTKAKALLLHYENSTLKLEMALRRGLRYERAAVRNEAGGLGAILSAGIERVIDQTAPRLAACRSEPERRAILAKEIKRLRYIVQREMPRALRRMRANVQKTKEAAP